MGADLLVPAVALATAAASALGSIEIIESGRRAARQQRVELRFGRDVTPQAILAAVEAVAGLQRHAVAVLEVRATHAGITHWLTADPATLDTLRGRLRATLPGLRFVPLPHEAREPAPDFRYGRRIVLRGGLKTVRDDLPAETNAALLASLQPVGEREAIVVRWVIGPGRAVQVPQVQRGEAIEAEERRRLRMKNAGSVVRARGTVAVSAGHPRRADHLLSRVSAVMRTRNTPYGQLRMVPRSGAALRRDLARTSFWFGARYASSELAGLVGWPVSGAAIPGVQIGTSPLLLPSVRLPRTGRVLGTATWPGAERPIAQPVLGGLSHTLAAGPTGVGKSTLITRLVTADMAAGRGVVVIDGKGDTARQVLARIPESRRDDVVVLDCAHPGPQPGLSLFGVGDPELAADVVLGVISDLFKDTWGPLSERYLRAGLMAVAHDPGGTLADVPFVFTDAAYRRRLVGHLRDPLTKATFAGFEAMKPGERQQQLAAPLGKLGQLLGRPIVRTVLGQSAPTLDFREVLDRGRIVVISLEPTRVGAPAARLVGALSVFGLFQAVQGRARIGTADRKPFFVYIDEPRALGDLPMPLDVLLEQARGLGVGITLAPQSMKQLPASVRDVALTNVATRIVFQQNSEDARLLARDLRGVEPEDLQDLAAYEAVARVGLGPGDVAPPVTIRTLPPGSATSDPDAVRRTAAERWGQSIEEVDAGLEERHREVATTPVGRKRRSS